jgi:hypothetical protein
LYFLTYIKRRENQNGACSKIKNTCYLRPTNKFIMSTRRTKMAGSGCTHYNLIEHKDSRWRSPAHTHLKLSGSSDRTTPFRWVPRELFLLSEIFGTGSALHASDRANKKSHGRCLFLFPPAWWFREKNRHGSVELMTKTESL